MTRRSNLVSIIRTCTCSRRSLNSIPQFYSQSRSFNSTSLLENIKGKNVIRFEVSRNYNTSSRLKRVIVEKEEEEDFLNDQDEIPIASTSAIPYTERSVSSLLRNLRRINSSSNIPTSSVISQLRDNSESWFDEENTRSSPPTPPPLIKLDPELHRSNPHIFSAFLLQMLCLGASALGLITGRGARPWNIEGDHDLSLRRSMGRRVARKLGEDDELVGINLLLTSYSQLQYEVEEEDSIPNTPRLSLDETIQPITSLLLQLAEKTPNRWTIAALLSFVNSPVSSPSSPTLSSTITTTSLLPSKQSRFELARPILVAWAWRAFYPLLLPESPTDLSPLDYNIIQSFARFLLESSKFPHALDLFHEILDDLLAILLPISTSKSVAGRIASIRSSPLPEYPNPLYLNLVALCLRFDRLHAVERFLRADSPLDPLSRLRLAQRALTRMSLSRELSRDSVLLEDLGRMFFQAVKDVVPKAAISGKRKSRRMDLCPVLSPAIAQIIEDGIKSYLTGFTVSIATEVLAYEIVLFVLQSTKIPPFSEEFFISFFNRFIGARNPTKALAIFNEIPKTSRQLSYYNILLRTHHAPTSDKVWKELSYRKEISPSPDSFDARLTSHSHQENNNLIGAREDLRIMKNQFGFERTIPMRNKLLKIIVAKGSESSMNRAWSNMIKGGRDEYQLKMDAASYNIRAVSRLNEMAGKKELEKYKEAISRGERAAVKRGEGGTTTNGATKNIALKIMTRSKEVDAKDLIQFANNILGIDLTKEDEDEDKNVHVVVPKLTRKKLTNKEKELEEEERQVQKDRDFAVKILIRAFESRGEIRMKKRLIISRSREKTARKFNR